MTNYNEAMFKNKSHSAIWFYRLVRWAFAAFFIAVGFLYQDAWVAFIFGGIFLVTSFFKPVRCLQDGCNINTIKD
jgi:hypothetical protein